MRTLLLLVSALMLTGCRPDAGERWQGYLEAEFVHVAAPLAGKVETVDVTRGQRITAGQPLFTLERAAEVAAQREAADRLRAAEARLRDLGKGARPTELATLEARLEQGRAAAELSRRELTRTEELFQRGVLAASDLDRARLTHERNGRALEELAGQLATARLGGRSDALAAAESEVAAAAAALQRADWAVAQKSPVAPAAALVSDTLFRPGEFAPAGAPVVQLLPPENLKVRFFVPEAAFATLKAGDTVRVTITGIPSPLPARITYLAPRPEYTPPVLYNRENRAKLVFMIEAALTAGQTDALHPGQPVDVTRQP